MYSPMPYAPMPMYGGCCQPGQLYPGMMPFPLQASGSTIGGQPMAAGALANVQQESYIENILRLNLGKIATIYMTFENSKEWNSKIFKGKLEAAGRDHIIISDPATGMRYLLLMVYLDYITFDEPLNYEYPYA